MEEKNLRVKVSFCQDGPTFQERLQMILNSQAEGAPVPWNRRE